MRDIRIEESIVVDLEWDDNRGYFEDRLEVKGGNYNIFCDLYVYVENDDMYDDRPFYEKLGQNLKIEIDSLFVTDSFGNEVSLKDEEYDCIINNIKTNIEW